jgi:uncharacterized membrane protein YvlD (DUF360 family)
VLADATRRLIDFYALQARLVWEWRPGPVHLVRQALVSLVVGAVSLGVAAWVLPGVTLRDPPTAALVVVVIALLNAVVRPVLLAVVAPFSVAALVAVSLTFQVLAFLSAEQVVPSFEIDTVPSAVWASLLFAVVNMSLTAIVSPNQGESYYGLLVQRLARQRRDVVRSTDPGLVVIQIDGLGHGVLAHQIRAGRVPYLASLIRSGRARLSPWDVLLPSQTSASQAGILHGNNDGIPAFRWYEKERRRLMVSNRPADAAEIERRVSDGAGLLSNGGASIGNLLSGDAERAYLTLSTLRVSGQGLGRSQAFYSFFLSPSGYLSTLLLTLGEATKELISAARTARAGIEPRIHRGPRYALARAVTNVLLRGLSTSLVIDEMYRGTPVIYVDYVDYDEIAHYSGPERGEALDALDGVDRTIRHIARAAGSAPRPYRFVVLSDHGQTLGATFRSRFGVSIEGHIRAVTGQAIRAATARTEEWRALTALASEMRDASGATGAIVRRAMPAATGDVAVGLGPAPASDLGIGPADLVVCASGNLALVYFSKDRNRLTEGGLEAMHPGLVRSLAEHPGIGLVLVRGDDGEGVVIGAEGRRTLGGGAVVGVDPAAVYGPRALESLVRLDAMAHVGDLVLISTYEPDTDEVAAFEELIGSHGGLGGGQTQAFVLHPREWVVDAPMVGAPAVYRQLRTWLAGLGIELGKPGAVAAQVEDTLSPLAEPEPVPEPVGVASGPTSGVPRA